MSEVQQDDYQGGGHELAVRHQTTRTVDMRSQATDSWTDVLGDVGTLARGVAATEFVPKGLRCECRKPNDCTCGGVAKTSAAILYGRELGLPPMTGLGSTHVIEGKAGISAEMMRALILQAGHELVFKEASAARCEMWGRRKGQDEWTVAVWTIQEAHQIQVIVAKGPKWGPLSSKAVWRSYPSEMLVARTTTRLARMIFPDVAHGMRTTEELQDMSTVVDGEFVEEAPAAPTVQRRQTTARRPQPSPATQEEPVEVPARRTVGRPAPRGTKTAEPTPEPAQQAPEDAPKVTTIAPEPQPDADGVVDAEIVDEPAVEDKARKGATIALMGHFKRLDVTDRAERLWYTGVIAGREVESTKDLDLEELRKVVHTLERAKNIDVINQLVDKSEKSER